MPKLKKEKKEDLDEEDFEIDPRRARTIAKVWIRGGELVPFDMQHSTKKFFGVVEWKITNPSGLEITAGARKIALEPDLVSEVVFSNMHPIPIDGTRDQLANEDHIQLFKQLNPALAETTLIAHKPKNLPSPDTDNEVLALLRRAQYSDGVTPPCCALVLRQAQEESVTTSS